MSRKAKELIHYYKVNPELAAFMLRREARLTKQKDKHDTGCYHPKNTGIGKKDTSFYDGCNHVRFDRKKLPKSGKSIINDTFVEKKGFVWLVWHLKTRALLGVIYNDTNIEKLTEEWKRRFNELYSNSIIGN